MIGFGLIGCGRIADKHIASLAACRDAELVALCDIRPERMEEAAEVYRARSGSELSIATYDDIGRLLTDHRVQAVVISTHSAMHAEVAIRALRAGKHIMLEKPIALSIEDARKVAQLADMHRLRVQVCHQLRYRPLMRRVKQLIDQGSLGKLYMGSVSIRLQRSKQYYEEAAWRGTWDQDGGMLLNQGIHLIDLLQWFLGDASTVYGQMTRTELPKQTEDVAACVVRFKEGAIGVIEANTISQPNNLDNEITLFGDKGTISIGGIKLNEIRRWYCEDGEMYPDATSLQIDEHLAMYDCFVRTLSTVGSQGSVGTSADLMDEGANTPDDVGLTESSAHDGGGHAEADEDVDIGQVEVSKGDDTWLADADESGHIWQVDAREGSKALEIISAMYESVRTKQEVRLPLASFSTNIMTEWEDE